MSLDIFAAQRIYSDRLQLQEGRSFPVLCDTSGIINTTYPAREYLSLEGSEMVTAIGFVTAPNWPHAMLRMYLQIHHTPVPYKIFFSQERAVQYLSSYQ